MNIRQEKERIYNMLDEITNERNKLTDAYLNLLKRLETIDDIERSSSEQSRVEPPVEVVVHVDKPVVKEPLEEPITVVLEEPTVESLSDIIDRHNQQFKDEEVVVVEKGNKIPKVLIEKELDKLPKNKMLSSERATSLILTILKDAGQPLKSSEIHQRLKHLTNHKITGKNFNSNILPRALKMNPNIERATFGYYQYRPKTTV